MTVLYKFSGNWVRWLRCQCGLCKLCVVGQQWEDNFFFLLIFFFSLFLHKREKNWKWTNPCCGSHLTHIRRHQREGSKGTTECQPCINTNAHTELMLPTQKYIRLSGHNGNNTQLPGGLRCTVLTFDKDVVTQFLRTHIKTHH